MKPGEWVLMGRLCTDFKTFKRPKRLDQRHNIAAPAGVRKSGVGKRFVAKAYFLRPDIEKEMEKKEYDKPPKKGPRSKPNGPEETTGKHPGEREQPAASERTGDTDTQDVTQTPSPEQANTAWRTPVTNEEEQEKITNADGDDLPTPEK